MDVNPLARSGDADDTQLSLIERLHQSGLNDDAWREFVDRYTAILRSWCRTWGVGASDVDDLVQETLISVLSSLERFEHRGPGSFRSWMKTIARRCFSRLIKHAQRNPAKGAIVLDGQLEVANEKLVDQFEQEAQRELLSLSMEMTRRRVAPSTWQAFEMTVLQEIPGTEVAGLLGLGIGSVYMARCRVQRMISEVLAQLDQPGLLDVGALDDHRP